MSSSSHGVLVTWHNSMSSCKFRKIFSALLTLHFVSILIPLILLFINRNWNFITSVLSELIVIFYKKSVFIRKSIIQNLWCRCRLYRLQSSNVLFVSSRYIDTSLIIHTGSPICLFLSLLITFVLDLNISLWYSIIWVVS